MHSKPFVRAVAVATAALVAGGAHAIGITDATGDWVPGFAGSKVGDLDVVGAFATYNASTDTFVFSGTMNADIGATPTGIYVWGINRGFGTAGFAGNGIDGVLFDSVIVFNADTSVRVTATNKVLPAGTVKIVGSTLLAAIPGADLPTVAGGFAKTGYTWNLWPRDGSLPSGFGQIADFAPDNSNFGVTTIAAVPEPASAALLVAGLAGLMAWRRRSTV